MTLNATTKSCDYCGETIDFYATRCQYCGSLLKLSPHDSSNTQNVQDDGQKATDTDATEITGFYQTELMLEQPKEKEAGPADHIDEQHVHFTSSSNNGYSEYHAGSKAGVMSGKQQLGNGMKVFLTLLFSFVPGLGQIAGFITAIVLFSSENDDKRSFGRALIIASIAMFAIHFIIFFFLTIIFTAILYK